MCSERNSTVHYRFVYNTTRNRKSGTDCLVSGVFILILQLFSANVDFLRRAETYITDGYDSLTNKRLLLVNKRYSSKKRRCSIVLIGYLKETNLGN